MLALVGSRVCYRTVGQGVFHCERCGGDRPYQHRSGRRWAHLLGIPLASLGDTGEHLRCLVCRTCYRVELLAVPTMDQMLAALLAGTRAAVLAMLRAGGAGSAAARRRGIQLIRAAGAPDYHDGQLLAALADPREQRALTGASGPGSPGPGEPGSGGHGSGMPGSGGHGLGLRPAIEALAAQLEVPALGWFLAKMVEVGLADGSLTGPERAVAGAIARYLGMTPAQGRAVISLTEAASQAG
jgi:hypothetical protein